MIFVAQVDPQTQALVQGLGFSTPALAESHMAQHLDYIYISTPGFVSPATHRYSDGQIILKQE